MMMKEALKIFKKYFSILLRRNNNNIQKSLCNFLILVLICNRTLKKEEKSPQTINRVKFQQFFFKMNEIKFKGKKIIFKL